MRENGFRAIGGLTQRLTSGLVAKGKKGGGRSGAPLARLKAEWPAIVGAELARVSRPDALLAGRRARGGSAGGPEGGKTLRLRVAGAASLEIQHSANRLVERVNGYFGHRFIDDIRLIQGGIAAAPAPRALPAPDPEAAARIANRVAGVKDPELREALARLGARIAAGRRGVLLGALGAFLFAPRGLRAQQPTDRQATEEQEKALALRPDDHVLGKADAPNLIIDYFSLTCPHCANFEAAVLPGLRREWIDTGKARFVYRHFPSDSIATHASELAECAGPSRFFETMDVLLRTQVDWLTSGDPEREMVKILTKKGIAATGKCFADDRLLDRIVADVQSGQAVGVNQTPTLFINGRNYGNPASVDGIGKILRQSGR
jgi:protein-disulfide isomerase